jgi:sulfonate transport system ATP-binding protein
VEEAIYLGNRVIVMQPNPGRIGEVVSIALDAARDRGDSALVHKRQEILSSLGVTAAA